jgi:hypothetical protein
MATVDPAAVSALLDVNVEPVTTAIPIVTTMARAYTRGNGFNGNEPNDEIAAVITTAAARLAANGAQLSHATTTGGLGVDVRSAFVGWSTAELAVLNRYRKTAM